MWCGKAAWYGFGVLFATSAVAQEGGARALGHGGAVTADGGDIGGGPENLAAASLEERYETLAGGTAGADATWGFSAAAMDTRTATIALAAGYSRSWDDVPPTGADLPGWKLPDRALVNPAVHQGAWAGAAYPFLDRRMSAALDLRYDHYESDLVGTQAAFNFGFGVAGRPWETVTLAANARNLLQNDFHDTVRTLSIGGRWDPGPYIGIGGDARTPLTRDLSWESMAWHLGADVGLVQVVKLRGGWYTDGDVHFATTGLGLHSEQADFDYGARIQTDEPGRNWHEIEIRVRF